MHKKCLAALPNLLCNWYPAHRQRTFFLVQRCHGSPSWGKDIYFIVELCTIQEHLQQCSVCDPAKIFLTSKFSCLLFPTPTIKLKLGLQMGGRLQITTHLDQANYLANQQQLLFAVPFTSLSKQCKNPGPKNHFAEPNWHVLTFLHPILICRVTYWARVELL
jgi:hypothetical protein